MHGGARHAPARLAIDGVERRRIPVRVGGNEALNLHVVEVADWSWWEEQSVSESANPFGAKLWPASLAVADYLAGLPADVLPATTVLEIGCGNGLCSLTAAARGAASVVASDLSEDALTLTQEAAQQQGLAVQTLRFDLADRATPLPPAQLVIAADVLYDASLATAVAHRVAEAAARGSWVVVGDQRRAGRQAFERTLGKLSAPRMFRFEQSTAVQLAAVGWKKKDVDLMLINPPEGS